MKVLLSTIWHSGSEYMRKRLLEQGHNVTFQHCEGHVWKVLKGTDFDEIHTTLRDPYLVAASWANQYNIKDAAIDSYWYTLWMNWSRLVHHHDAIIHHVHEFDGSVVNSKGDPLGLKLALKEGDIEKYWQHIPKNWIGFAFKCCGSEMTWSDTKNENAP